MIRQLVVAVFINVSILLFLGLKEIYKYEKTKNETNLNRHRFLMITVFFLTAGEVAILETAIQMGRLVTNGGNLLWIHLIFALPFLISLPVLIFWKNGIRFPFLHRKLGYTSIAMFIGTFTTGLMLLYG